MYHTYLLMFLLMHVLGDFYVQTNQIAKQKEENYFTACVKINGRYFEH